MIQEEKQLLLRDLCARLPYSTKCYCKWSKEASNDTGGCIQELSTFLLDEFEMMDDPDCDCQVSEIKPYLRPMSSMAEEEKKEFSVFIGKTEMYVQEICLDADSMINPIIGGYKCIYWGLFDKCIDWLNAHHFDYRGLIRKGLALEAPENMYKTE